MTTIARKGFGQRSGNFKHLNHITGRSLNHLARMNEERLVEILNTYIECGEDRPPWMVRARLATTKKQDNQKIDVVLTTHGCPIFLQVKSSESGKRKFEEQRKRNCGRRLRIAVVGIVVVNDGKTNKKILGEALHEVNRIKKIVDRYNNFLPANHPALR